MAPKGNKHALGCTTSGAPKLYTDEVISGYAKKMVEWAKSFPVGQPLFYKRFFLDNDLHPKYASEWSEKHPEFREALEYVKHYQETNLLENATIENYSANFCKFVLKCNHGYREGDEGLQQVIVKVKDIT
jgi:hypothetical protein